jgi:hypothetical protein
LSWAGDDDTRRKIVAAVVGALLRDEYPPFRLDTGGADPGTVPAAPPPPPDRPGELVATGPRSD